MRGGLGWPPKGLGNGNKDGDDRVSFGVARTTSESFWCREGRHTACIHVLDGVERLPLPYRINEDLATAVCCTCACHQDCPLSGQGTGAGWPGTCTCLGTLRLTHRRPGSHDGGVNFAAIVREGVETGRRRSRARQELRRRARGLDSQAVDGLLGVIWPEHGLPVPPAHIRQSLVERAMGPSNPIVDLRTTVDALEGTRRSIANIVRIFRQDGEEPDGREDPEESATFAIETGSDSVEVLLDPGTQPRVAAMSDGAAFSSRAVTTATVVLRPGPNGHLDVFEHQATTSPGPVRLGRVPAPDAEPYRPSLAAAERVGQVATCPALRMGTRDGGWRLCVKLPLRPRM